MGRLRFHIGSLLILVVFLGVGFAALREAGDLWDSVVLSATVVVLLVSILLAAHRSGASRAFWAGFALFGWSYLGLTAIPSIGHRLLTTRALVQLEALVPDHAVTLVAQPQGGSGNVNLFVTTPSVASPTQGNLWLDSSGSSSMWVWDTPPVPFPWTGGPRAWHFVHIGHSLFALILAWIGGLLSRHLSGKLSKGGRGASEGGP